MFGMKKRGLLGFLSLAAVAVFVGVFLVGFAEASPKQMEGTWQIRNGIGVFEHDEEEANIIVEGRGTFNISNVVEVDENEGTLSISGSMNYSFFWEDNRGPLDGNPHNIPISQTDGVGYLLEEGVYWFELEDIGFMGVEIISDNKAVITSVFLGEGYSAMLMFDATKGGGGSSSGGCNAAPGLLTALSLIPLFFIKRKR